MSINAQVGFLIPLQARELGAGFDQIGLIIGIGSMMAALLSISLGALIDRWGSRACFILGTAVCAFVSALYILPTNFWWFIALQPLLGLSRGCGWLASQVYVTSVGDPQDRSRHAGRFSFCANIGQLAGPLMVGFAAQAFGLRWALAVPAVYSLVFLLVGVFLRPLANGHIGAVAHGTGLRAAVPMLKIPGIQFAMIVTFARLWVNIVFTTFLPLLLVEQGTATGVVGAIMSVTGLVATLTAPTAGALTRLFSSEYTVANLSVASGAIGLMATPLLVSTPFVVVLPCLVGVSVGLSLPMLMSIVGNSAPAGSTGVALGLRSLANQTASTTGPLVVGPLIAVFSISLGFVAAGMVTATVLALAHVCVGRKIHERRVGKASARRARQG